MIISYLIVLVLSAVTAITTITAYPMETKHNNALAHAIEDTFWVEEYGKVPIFAANYVRARLSTFGEDGLVHPCARTRTPSCGEEQITIHARGKSSPFKQRTGSIFESEMYYCII
uniref:Secreted protein n=1 Tax=Panagrellus redivivus TaxID=6233 RepID=A0A7E4VBP0_PANRE